MQLLFLYTELLLHWGFIVRQVGASAAQLAYPLPPPTTIVGAYMNPVARTLSLGEELERRKPSKGLPVSGRVMKCALQATIAAGAGLSGNTGVAVFEEPTRLLAAAYKGGGSYERALKKPPYLAQQEVMPVQAAGSASAPGATLITAWLVDVERFADCLEKPLEEVVNALLDSAWSIYRIGSREGLASVVRAGASWDPDIIGEGRVFASRLYQTRECAEPLEAHYAELLLPGLDYRETAFIVPAYPMSGGSLLFPPPEPLKLAVKSRCIALKASQADGIALCTRRERVQAR